MQDPAIAMRSTIVKLLEPWKHALNLWRSVKGSVDKCCFVGQPSQRALEALTLFMLAVRLDLLMGDELDDTDWFSYYRRPVNGIRAMISVNEDIQALAPFFGLQQVENEEFRVVLQTITKLGQTTAPVVIPVDVRVYDHGYMSLSDYTTELPRLMSGPTSDFDVRFEVASVRLTLSERTLSSELVEAMTALVRDWKRVTFFFFGVNPFWVNCSQLQFETFISTVTPSLVSVALDTDKNQREDAHIAQAAPMVCRALKHCTRFSSVGSGLTLSCNHSAWRVILDSLVDLLSPGTATVDKIQFTPEDSLAAGDRKFLREWVTAKPANRTLFSSSDLVSLSLNQVGIEFLCELIPMVGSIRCSNFVKLHSPQRETFHLFAIAPSKFTAIRSVTIDGAKMDAEEVTALASLLRLEVLDLTNVGLDRGAFLGFVTSLVPPPDNIERWYRRSFTSLALRNCIDSNDSDGIADEAVGKVMLQVVQINRYLTRLYIHDKDAKAASWALIKTHTGNNAIVLAHAQARCSFLSVLRKRGEHLTGGGNVDAFILRRIFEFSHPRVVLEVFVHQWR